MLSFVIFRLVSKQLLKVQKLTIQPNKNTNAVFSYNKGVML